MKKIFTILGVSSLRDLLVTWLIFRLMQCNGLVCIGGPSGTGKTFLALYMAACVGLGLPFFGFPARKSRVIYICLEGQAGLRQRIKAWEVHHQMPFPDNVQFILDPFVLNSTSDPLAVAKLINESGGAELIFIDTLAKASPDADENSSRDMGRVIEGATVLQSATKATVVLIHHPGKDRERGLRGHSSLYAALDTVIMVDRNGDRNFWTVAKSKDGKDGFSHSFTMTEVQIGTDEFEQPVTSLVVEPSGDPLRLQPKHELRGGNQKSILEGFTDLITEMRHLASGCGEDWPLGISFTDAVDQLKNRLTTVDDKHRQIRTKEALLALIDKGYLFCDGDLVDLPRPTTEEMEIV